MSEIASVSPTTPARQLRRRREIMDAAAAVFAKKGYHAATTRDIADSLGMQPGSLYYYFESKEAALEEICRIGGSEFVDHIEAILATGMPTRELIRSVIGKHLQGDRRHYVTCFAHNRRFLPADVVPEMNRLARRYTKFWEDVFHRGIARGEVPAELDCRLAATAAVALCNGAVPYLEPKAPEEIAEFVDGLAALFMSGALRS